MWAFLDTMWAFPARFHLGNYYTNTPIQAHTGPYTQRSLRIGGALKLEGNLYQVTCGMNYATKELLITYIKL